MPLSKEYCSTLPTHTPSVCSENLDSTFSSGIGYFSVHLQAFQVTGSPLEMCVGFFHGQNL